MTALGPSRCSEARLLPDGPRRSAGDAALLNGIAAHVHDYDDVALDGHPSAVLVPALLAEGEATGAKGSDLIRGYVAGYGLGRALESEPGTAACARMASERGLRRRRGSRRLRSPAPARRESTNERPRARRSSGERSDRKFRHDGEIFSGRPRRRIRFAVSTHGDGRRRRSRMKSSSTRPAS